MKPAVKVSSVAPIDALVYICKLYGSDAILSAN